MQEYHRFRDALSLGYEELREREDEAESRARMFAKYGVDNYRDLWSALVKQGNWKASIERSGTDAWRKAVEAKASEYR